MLVCIVLLLTAAHVGATPEPDEMRSDLWLKAKLVTAYTLNQHLNPFRIHVEVKDGVATLTGSVDSAVERDLATEIARGVDGIHEVRDRIEVAPGAGTAERREPEFFRTVEDATITARVKTRLLWNRNTNGLDIEVETDHGVVTLKGKVASGAHRDLAVQLAKNTTGVQRVRDELAVAPAPGQPKADDPLATMTEAAGDAWITAKVKSVLLFSKEAEDADIAVSTKRRVVTLRGSVPSAAQQRAIEHLVGEIVGVKGVHSELAVVDTP